MGQVPATTNDQPKVQPERATVAAVAAVSRLNGWLRAHNRTALAAAGFSLLMAVLLFGLAFGGIYAGLVILTSINKSIQGVSLETAADLSRLRALYPPAFLACASFCTLLATLVTHWQRAAHWHDAMPFLFRAAFDLVTFPAAMLVDGLDTLRALVWLRRKDRPLACALLARLDAGGGRLAVGRLSLDTPDRPQLLRVLQALHVAQVLETRAGLDEPHLCWRSREASERLAIRLG